MWQYQKVLDKEFEKMSIKIWHKQAMVVSVCIYQNLLDSILKIGAFSKFPSNNYIA